MSEPGENQVVHTETPSGGQEADTAVGSQHIELPPREPARVPSLHLSDGQTDSGYAKRSAPAPTVPGYEILKELGRGGMGVVYQARQLSLNRLVALKMIRAGDLAGPEELLRFKREAEAVARLKHPNIVQIYEVNECDSRPYFLLEYVDGGNLAQRIHGVPQSPPLAAQVVETLARAVHAAHQCGIVHRDLKPANVLLQSTAQGDPQTARQGSGVTGSMSPGLPVSLSDCIPKIADFGLAKRLDAGAAQTLTGTVMGTPSYMAPEQAAGKTKDVGAATDVYALGAILYELLTGQAPFVAESWEATRQLVLTQETIPPRRLQPKLPRDLQTICLKCLEKEPSKRFASALELADELQLHLDGKPIRSRPVGRVEWLWRWSRRKPALAGLSGLTTLIVVTAVVVSVCFSGYRSRLSREDQITKAYKALDEGIALCEKGDIGRGMLWLARSLELAPQDEAHLQWLIRGNLSGWACKVNRLKAILPHDSAVLAVAFSTDGKTMVTGCADGAAQLWDATTCEPIGQLLGHRGEVLAVATSIDGKCIVTGSRDHRARLWDKATRKTIREFPHEDDVLAVAFSPEGDTVLTGCRDHTARLWKAATGKLIGEPLRHADVVYAVAFSPDGTTALTGSLDTTAKFWDAVTGADLRRVLPHKESIHSVAFSPDGLTVATGTKSEAHVWDVRTLTQVGLPIPHRRAVRSVAYSRDSRLFLTACAENCRLWERDSRVPFGSLRCHQGDVTTAAFSPDGKTVLTAGVDGTARLLEVASRQGPKFSLRHEKIVKAVAFSRSGAMVVTGSDDKTAQVWESTSGKAVGPRLSHDAEVSAVAFSPDGEIVLTASEDHTAQRWRAATGERLEPPMRHDNKVSAVAVSPDGKTVLTGSWDRSARLWDTATGSQRALLQHQESVYAAAFSHDGRYALSGSRDGTAKLWDTSSGAHIQTLQTEMAVYSIAFSADGKHVLTGSANGIAQLWNPFTGQCLRALQHPDHEIVLHVAFGADSRTVLTASRDKIARLWLASTGQPHGEALEHEASVLSAVVSPDGRLVLTGSADHNARLWDSATGKRFGPALRHGALVCKVAFCPNNKLVFTGCADHFGRLWEVPLPIKGSVEQLSLCVQETTGMQLDDSTAVRVLDYKTWEKCRQRIVQLGGPPLQ